MAGWTQMVGEAVCLPFNNIDTDQIIPARFMSASREEGYGNYLFHDMRRDENGIFSKDFSLNEHKHANILITGKNFGCGSSREAAVYALVDAGIQAVIAPSFGDIFASNAVNNGLLPAPMKQDNIDCIMNEMGQSSQKSKIDLMESTIELGREKFQFSIEENWRTKLMKGWDDIDLTLQYADHIKKFKHTRIQTCSWALPRGALVSGGC